MVVVRAERGDRILGALGYDHVSQQEAPARAKHPVDALKKLRLVVSLQMVHDESRDDEIERTAGKRILDPADAQLHPVRVEESAGCGEHLRARVHTDELSEWVRREEPPGRLAGAGPQLED
jgi:hypothetical protein